MSIYIVNDKMVQLVCSSEEAMNELVNYDSFLTNIQKMKLLSATLSKDGEDWCVLSGQNLAFDRAGFGVTIADAIKDYVSIYLDNSKKVAS